MHGQFLTWRQVPWGESSVQNAAMQAMICARNMPSAGAIPVRRSVPHLLLHRGRQPGRAAERGRAGKPPHRAAAAHAGAHGRPLHATTLCLFWSARDVDGHAPSCFRPIMMLPCIHAGTLTDSSARYAALHLVLSWCRNSVHARRSPTRQTLTRQSATAPCPTMLCTTASCTWCAILLHTRPFP